MAIHPNALGKAVAEIRAAKGWTQKHIAEVSGFTVNYLSLIENGERVLSLDGLNRLAKAFDVPAEWIMFLAGGPNTGKYKRLTEATKAAIRSVIAGVEEKANARDTCGADVIRGTSQPKA